MSKEYNSEKLKTINSVSPSFCLAKWLQVTIDIVNGTTNSCHHPQRHYIPIQELEKDPTALHNTNFKKEQRKMMLEGQRPPECSYCWDMEDLGNQYSDRYIKSTDSWAWDDLQRVAKMPWEVNVNPRYVEVMIDNTCNFSCAYCCADISSSVAAEMQKFGPYPVKDPSNRIADSKATPESKRKFLEAFEKWLPQVIHDIRVLRITGGEPLLSSTFWKLLGTLKEKKNPTLSFAVNSHLKHDLVMIEKFCTLINELIDNKSIGGFEVYTSLDTHGDQAEYIRHGLKYSTVLRNIEYIQSRIPSVKIIIMSTFNILSISKFDLLADDILQLRKKNVNIVLDVSYLKKPYFLRADMANNELINKFEIACEKMSRPDSGFYIHEMVKTKNILSWLKLKQDPDDLRLRRSDFLKFVTEFDKRKKKNFLKTFPEYKNFFIQCKQAIFENLDISP